MRTSHRTRGDRLARNSDPETSRQAARMAKGDLEDSHANLILDALTRFQTEKGMTAEQIGDRCGLDLVQVARRMTRLVRKGDVEVVSKALISSGRLGRTYHTVES